MSNVGQGLGMIGGVVLTEYSSRFSSSSLIWGIHWRSRVTSSPRQVGGDYQGIGSISRQRLGMLDQHCFGLPLSIKYELIATFAVLIERNGIL